MAARPACPAFKADGSRFDQRTFSGRLRHFLDVVDPRTLFTSTTRLKSSLELLEMFEKGALPPGTTNNDLWAAQKIKQAIIHPDTGEKIVMPFRMSGFVPFGSPIVVGLLLPNPGMTQMIFWQWLNMTHNACVNYANRNATKPTPLNRFLIGYGGAVSSAVGIALGLSHLIKKANSFSPATKVLIQKFVPFPAVCECCLTVTSNGDPESESSEESEPDEPKPKKTKKRGMNAVEKAKFEKELVKKEESLLDLSCVPKSEDDFDRLVIQSPDSSMVWLTYIAHQLDGTGLDAARTVTERALKTINFREEQERLNIWVAFMNMENLYGTPESLKKVVDRALRHNEPIKIHKQLVSIYIGSGKVDKAEQLYQTMSKKYSHVKEVWVDFGEFHFKNGQLESARKLMKKSFNILTQKEHVYLICQFAQMEFKHGEPERGRTLFETTLSSYQSRTDIWSVFIDTMIKQGDLVAVRQLFDRVTHMDFSVKKMRFFFKKFMDFETKHGDSGSINYVRQKAIDYVEQTEEATSG